MQIEICNASVIYTKSTLFQSSRWRPPCQSIAHERLPILLLLTQHRICHHFLKHLSSTFDDLELGLNLRTVQSHPRSKFMVPIDSTELVSYSASIRPIVVSVTVSEMFDI